MTQAEIQADMNTPVSAVGGTGVPNVVGLAQAAAGAAITSAGLAMGAITTVSSATVPAGTVISQNPVAGTSVPPATPVDLIVSLGPAPVVVPSVVGLTQAAAATAIGARGLAVGVVTTANSNTVPAGAVISQDPAAGTSVAPATAVDLVVSLGPVPVVVPNVVGLTQAAAATAIGVRGLTVGVVTTANSNTVPAGTVISQSPSAGTFVPVGGAVDMVVSAGPASGLVAAYSFNQGIGTKAVDASGNGNDGAIVNATWTTAGRFGGALLFNGTNARVTVNDAASIDLTNGMTIEAWVRPTASMGTSWRSIVVKERPGGRAYALYANTNARRPGGYINVGVDRNVQGTSTVPTNVWTHLAATYTGTTLSLYVNGGLVRSATLPGAIVTSGGALQIGGNLIWGQFFRGDIDELRIYNFARSAAQIVTDMNSSITP